MKRRALLAAPSLLLATPALAQLFSPSAPTLADLDGLRVPGVSASFDFSAGTMPPDATLTRASVGWRIDETGTLVSMPVDAPRFDYVGNPPFLRGLWVEAAATDIVRNSSAIGAVAPSTPPTNWNFPAMAAGWNFSIVGSGVEAGIPYVDVRFFGNRASSSAYSIDIETSPGPATVAGDVWGARGFVKVASVTTGFLQAARVSAVQFNSGGGQLATLTLATLSTAEIPVGGSSLLRQGTMGGAAAMADPLTASMRPRFQLTLPAGDIDFVVRIGLPSFFRTDPANVGGGDKFSNIVTTTAQVTRAADVLAVALANGTYAMEVRTLNSTVYPNQVIDSGTWIVPPQFLPIRQVVARRTA